MIESRENEWKNKGEYIAIGNQPRWREGGGRGTKKAIAIGLAIG
jgi:hypothetical protein